MESTPIRRTAHQNRCDELINDLSNPFRKSGLTLTLAEANMVVCCYKNLMKEKAAKKPLSVRDLQRPVERCAAYTGVERKTVMQLWKQYQANPANLNFRTGLTPHKDRANNRMFAAYDDTDVLEVISEVKSFIRQKHTNGTPITCTEIYGFLIDKYPDFPYSRRTVRRFVLQRMGFKYAKLRGQKKCIIENPKYVKWRYRFLSALEANQNLPDNERLHEVYSDESYIWQTHARSFSRMADSGEDMEVSLNRKKWKGPRLIFFHAGGEFGFVPGARLIYKASKQRGDYHGNIDSDMYERWFQEKLLPGMNKVKQQTGKGCLLILDNAKYHKRSSVDFQPHKATVADLKAFLVDRRLQFKPYWLRADYMRAVRRYIATQPTVVELLASKHGHKVIFQPPYHSEISPIEKVWAQTKYNVGVQYDNNTSLDDVERRLNHEFDIYSVEQWVKVSKHCEKVRKTMWEEDKMLRLEEENYTGTGLSDRDDDEDDSDSDASEGENEGDDVDNDTFFMNIALEIEEEKLRKEAEAEKRARRKRKTPQSTLSERGDSDGDNGTSLGENAQETAEKQHRTCIVM